MSRLITTLRVLNLFSAGILCGGLVMVALVLRPTLHDVPLSAAVQVHQLMIPRANRYMPLCGTLAALSVVALLKLRIPRRSAFFYRWGLAFWATAGLISLFLNAPADRAIAKWSVNTLANEHTAQFAWAEPPPAEEERRTWQSWDTFNVLRTVASAVGLALFAVANLQARGHEPES